MLSGHREAVSSCWLVVYLQVFLERKNRRIQRVKEQPLWNKAVWQTLVFSSERSVSAAPMG